MADSSLAPALVMNMFYTGLGIARTLGERGIPVIGLSANKGIYGNSTRFAKTVFCPDSRNSPHELLERFLEIGRTLPRRGVIFPTRDDDVVFLDRFRRELEKFFSLVVPASPVVRTALSKWHTYRAAVAAGVATPRCWLLTGTEQLKQVADEMTLPVVLKPDSSHHWRLGSNWEIVGGRKAVPVASKEELIRAYAELARARVPVLAQELIPGTDQMLVITACYLDRHSNWLASFQTQKLLQSPDAFGTGTIVQAVERPELLEPTRQLLQSMCYTGIAEVEYKWHAGKNEFQLIEINPRPWDQHRLGLACGADLIYLAYCEHAGIPLPPVRNVTSAQKWIAEDSLLLAVLRMIWRRDPRLGTIFQLVRGKRLYAISSMRDPMPALAYFTTRFAPGLVASAARFIGAALRPAKHGGVERSAMKSPLEKGKSHV